MIKSRLRMGLGPQVQGPYKLNCLNRISSSIASHRLSSVVRLVRFTSGDARSDALARTYGMNDATNSQSDVAAWHALSADEVLRRLETDARSGIDDAEGKRRLQEYGANRLPAGRKRGPVERFVSQLNNVLVYVLIGAGFIKLMMGLWLDASIILGVVVLNALLGFIQEGKAEKSLDSISKMLSPEARTLRGGQSRMMPAEDLVPGDVVLLESGDKIPADLRLVDVKNLRTEEAALTGEFRTVRQIGRPSFGQRHRRRPQRHGVLGDARGFGTLDRGGRRDGQRHRAGTHQPDARRREPARDALAEANQEVWL